MCNENKDCEDSLNIIKEPSFISEEYPILLNYFTEEYFLYLANILYLADQDSTVHQIYYPIIPDTRKASDYYINSLFSCKYNNFPKTVASI